MEKNKLKINRFGKISTVIPAILAAGMVNCAAATFRTSPNSKSTSLGNKTLVYEKASSNYTEEKTLNTMNEILNSDLNQMKSYDRLEANVQNEVAGYLSDMNANSLELARLYKSMEDNTITNSGLSTDQINKIAANGGVDTPDDVNVKVVRSAMQHNMHMVLDTQSLIRFGADEAEITIMDEGDGNNGYSEYLRFNTKDKRDMRKESTAVLNAAEIDILNYTQYEYTVNGQNGKKISNQISGNMNKIKSLVSKTNFNQNDYKNLLNLINETADLLPEAMFGTRAMRRGLVIEFASSYAMNQMLTILANLGYDIDNIKPGVFVEQKQKQAKEPTISLSPSISATNKHAGLGINLSATNQLSKNWNITYGGETNFVKNYDGSEAGLQILNNVDFERSLKHGHISIGSKGGMQFDTKKGFSTPFGIQGGYTWNINNNFSLDFGINSLLNIQRSLVDIGASIGASYRTKSLVIRFAINLGYTASWEKSNPTIIDPTPIDPTPIDPTPIDPTPITPDDSKDPADKIYGSDEVIKPNPDDVIDKGNIQDLPEKPVDLDLYK